MINLNKGLSNPLLTSITLKIRGEEAENFVPEKLYSSHKYYVTHKVSGVNPMGSLHARLVVEDPITNQEILSKDGKIIVKHINSTLEPTLSFNEDEEAFVGEMRMQFTSSSYKFGKGYFRMSFTYYDSQDQPLFTLQSPPFRVYARKTSTDTQTLAPGKKKISGKRKRKGSEGSPEPKKQRNDSSDRPIQNIVQNGNTSYQVHTNAHTAATNPGQDISRTQLQQLQANQMKQDPTWKGSEEQNQLQHIPTQDAAMKGPDVVSQPNAVLPPQSQQTQLYSQFQEKLQQLMAIHQHIKKPEQEKVTASSIDRLLSMDQNAQGQPNRPGAPESMPAPSNEKRAQIFEKSQVDKPQAPNQGNENQTQQQFQVNTYSAKGEHPFGYPPSKPQIQTRQGNQKDSNLIVADPRPSFLTESTNQKSLLPQSSKSLKGFSPLISTPKLLEEDLKLKTPTEELLRSVKSPDKFDGFGTVVTPNLMSTPSEFFSKDFSSSSPSVFSSETKGDK